MQFLLFPPAAIRAVPEAPMAKTSGIHCKNSIVFVLQHQLMLKPALAYPATVFSKDNPLAVAENTSISRVWAVTGILSPVCTPFSNVPTDMIPERDGVKLISVPAMGENTLFGVADW